MINVTKQKNGEILVIEIAGAIEECFDFDPLFGAIPREIHVNTKGVSRINSVGVKGWIKYFQDLRSRLVKVVFVHCSVAIVEQLNLISNFACGGAVDSLLYVPYICQKCGMGSAAFYTVAKLKDIKYKVPDGTCPKCSEPAIFDDISEEYFAFLMTDHD